MANVVVVVGGEGGGRRRGGGRHKKGDEERKKAKGWWTEPRFADAESLSPQLTTLQPLCCKMLAVPLWTYQSREEREGRGKGV